MKKENELEKRKRKDLEESRCSRKAEIETKEKKLKTKRWEKAREDLCQLKGNVRERNGSGSSWKD